MQFFQIPFKSLLEEQSSATAQDCQEDATPQDHQRLSMYGILSTPIF